MKYFEIKKDKINFFLLTLLPTILTFGIFIFLIFVFIVPYFEHNMLNGKKELLHELVNTTLGIASKYKSDADKGIISDSTAKDLAKTRIENLRYGIDNKDYFWITDKSPNMIMHPYRIDLNGKDLSGFEDANGKKIFVEFVKVVNLQNEGYVDYMWQWMDDSTRIVPKISYVKEFKEWGWVIGTGVYIEDVRREISAIEKSLILVSMGISIIMAFLLTIIVMRNLQIEKKRKVAREELNASHDRYKALVEASTEGAIMIIEGKCVYSNKKIYEILKYTEGDPVFNKLENLMNPKRINDLTLLNEFQNSLSYSLEMETELLTLDNKPVTALLSISKITLSDKNGLIILVKDLSREIIKNKDDQFREKGPQSYDLFDKLGLGAFRLSSLKKPKIIAFNSKFFSLFEFSSIDEVSNFHIWDLIEKSDSQQQFLSTLFESNVLQEYELKMRSVRGSLLELSIYATIEYDESHNVKYVDVFFLDITKKKTKDSNLVLLLAELQSSFSYLNQPIDLYIEEVILCSGSLSIKKAAELMTIHNSNVVLIKSSDEEYIGVLTDNDIRKRAITSNLSLETPVQNVMSSPIIFINSNSTLSDAILSMQKNKISHLFVKRRNEKIAGVINITNLNNFQFNNPIILYESIRNSNSVKELKNVFACLPYYAEVLINSGSRAVNITKTITLIADLITSKLTEFVFYELGNPPARFALVALGSEGRKEQTIVSDQDNALIYDDNVENMQNVHNYFLKFGERINALLNEIGYVFCKGEIMAMNPKWNQPLKIWKKYFQDWITLPEPKNLLDLSVFFDLRCIFGEESFIKELNDHINRTLIDNPAFFNYLARECMNYKIPLGIFGKIQTESSEEHTKGINIKNVIRVIVNIMRLYSMQNHYFETNTTERMHFLYDKNVLSHQSYNDFVIAFDFLMLLHFKKQTLAFQQNRKMDNYINLSELSSIEVNSLKTILSQISTFQARIKHDFSISE